MKTFLKGLVAIGSVAVALLLAPGAQAQEPQCGFPQGPITRTVAGAGSARGRILRARLRAGNPATNNGTASFFCRQAYPGETSSNGACQSQAGDLSDGRITVNGDWGSFGVTACPNGSVTGDAPNVAFATSIRMKTDGITKEGSTFSRRSVTARP